MYSRIPPLQISGKRAVSYSFELDEEGAEHRFISSDGHPEEDVLDVRELQELWHHFAQLMKALRAVPGTEHHMSPDEFQKAARDWATMLHRVTFDDDVIPYIHCEFQKAARDWATMLHRVTFDDDVIPYIHCEFTLLVKYRVHLDQSAEKKKKKASN